MSTTPTFGQWLKRRRKVLGLTQRELAQKAGCAEVTLRKIEASDFHPSAQLAASLARAAGATDADLPELLSLARGAGAGFTARAHLLRPQRPNNLAAQLTPLIGRERDITAVRKRLLSDGARLITLLGPPGVGKTRLALAVAEDVLEYFEHGVFFVRLAPISNPDLVATTIAQALELQMTGPNPPELQLRAFLEEKHLLLVLDNFEQIVEAASLVDDLLRLCPWLHVLVTSRQPLRVRGERQMPVLPLTLPLEVKGASQPSAADVLRYSAVAMFAERAEAVQPDFVVSDGNAAPIAELCRRLDGLPLAIELVAARIKLLPPAELVARLSGSWLLSMDGLRDVSARQKTLRGAIGWSYGLLTPVEQTLFTRLAVFVGGCTLQAVEMMCEDIFLPAQVLERISSLLDKSLLHCEVGVYGQPRYVMLETVREYGLEQLELTGPNQELRRRHAYCVLRPIEKTKQTDFSPFSIALRRLIDDEIANLRAAIAWATEHDIQVALLLAAALSDWLFDRGPHAEGQGLISSILALPDASTHTVPRAKALFEAGILMLGIHDYVKSQAYLDECLALSQELGYAKGEADALFGLGQVASNQSDQASARLYLDSAQTIYRELRDLRGISQATMVLSYVSIYQADFSKARALAEECLALAHQAGVSNPWPLLSLGSIAMVEGDLVEARTFMEQAVTHLEAKWVRAHTLIWLGIIATIQHDFGKAHAFLDEAHSLSKELGDVRHAAVALPLALLAQKEGDHRGSLRWFRMGLPAVKFGTDISRLSGLGLVALTASMYHWDLAALLLGATTTVSTDTEPIMPFERDDYNRLLEATRAHLGAERYDSAWAEGRDRGLALTMEGAVAILEAVLNVRDQTAPS